MVAQIQCDNCGAVLLEEDVFCGECGAPRPSLADIVEPTTADAPEAQPLEFPPRLESTPTPPPPPADSSLMKWRVAFFTLIILGVLACCAGLASFALFGSTPSAETTPQEDWLYATICCLLPIGGAGAILATIGGVIWYTRLRES